MRSVNKIWLTILLFWLLSSSANAAEESIKSFNFGFIHPNGVYLLGYSVETRMDDNLYWYYSFGIPSLAAIGINRYSNYDGNGIATTVGVGLGVWFYASIAYQWKLAENNSLKLGAGVAVESSYGSDESADVFPIPVFAYDYRF